MGIMFLVLASTLFLLVTVDAAKPWPKEKPGHVHVEDYPMLDIVKKTTIDPYLYLNKPEVGSPRHFQCLPV